MAQSAQDALEELRDDVAELRKDIVTLNGKVAALEKSKPEGSGEDKGLRGEFDQLKAQLNARFGHSLE